MKAKGVSKEIVLLDMWHFSVIKDRHSGVHYQLISGQNMKNDFVQNGSMVGFCKMMQWK